jgi:hypothetical protein
MDSRQQLPSFLMYPSSSYGGIRSAPSRRITSPFKYGLSIMEHTKRPNSSGLPSLLGKGGDCPSSLLTASGKPSSSGVKNSPGACRQIC